MRLFNKMFCAVGRHTPDRGQARHDRDYWWSSCKVCETRLMRDPVGGWRRPTADELSTHEAQVAREKKSVSA